MCIRMFYCLPKVGCSFLSTEDHGRNDIFIMNKNWPSVVTRSETWLFVHIWAGFLSLSCNPTVIRRWSSNSYDPIYEVWNPSWFSSILYTSWVANHQDSLKTFPAFKSPYMNTFWREVIYWCLNLNMYCMWANLQIFCEKSAHFGINIICLRILCSHFIKSWSRVLTSNRWKFS
jgi:hypothetical protein